MNMEQSKSQLADRQMYNLIVIGLIVGIIIIGASILMTGL
jgi:hypothetical protein